MREKTNWFAAVDFLKMEADRKCCEYSLQVLPVLFGKYDPSSREDKMMSPELLQSFLVPGKSSCSGETASYMRISLLLMMGTTQYVKTVCCLKVLKSFLS